MKTCKICNIEKPLSEFYSGCNKCTNCVAAQKKSYYESNKDKISEQKKLYYIEKKTEMAEKKKVYYENNKEHLKEYNKNNYYVNKEGRAEYYQINKEIIVKKRKIYKSTHKELVKAQRRKHTKKQMLTNVNYKLRKNIRGRINNAIINGFGKKSHKTTVLLGCDWNTVRMHLESQFVNGMSWDNYGLFGWHIDHIRPCASFDLTDVDQQKECFNYKNLQPLWARDNLVKGCTFIGA